MTTKELQQILYSMLVGLDSVIEIEDITLVVEGQEYFIGMMNSLITINKMRHQDVNEIISQFKGIDISYNDII